ncbi:hypothetical protein tb265_32280 [Gemmatimonadetes bacterium T265]|nr:hypothetical protein tb265_32280 [Gemmatimonadetes bacterium T265]
MQQPTSSRETPEPIGIVISGPARTEVMPRFLAYVWGPAPEPVVIADAIAEPRAA